MLQSMGLQRVRHDLATEQQQQVMPVLVAGGKTTKRGSPSGLGSKLFSLIQFIVLVQSLSRVQLFVSPRTAACQASLSSTFSWSLLKLMSIESVMPSNHLILCHPLLLLPSVFASIRIFSNEFGSFHHVAKVLEASASVLPMNIQG